jgi:hypothetical protein
VHESAVCGRMERALNEALRGSGLFVENIELIEVGNVLTRPRAALRARFAESVLHDARAPRVDAVVDGARPAMERRVVHEANQRMARAEPLEPYVVAHVFRGSREHRAMIGSHDDQVQQRASRFLQHALDRAGLDVELGHVELREQSALFGLPGVALVVGLQRK